MTFVIWSYKEKTRYFSDVVYPDPENPVSGLKEET